MLVFMLYAMTTMGAANVATVDNTRVMYVGHVHHQEDVVTAEKNVEKAFESKGVHIIDWKVVESTEI
jgi:hypothetical protein